MPSGESVSSKANNVAGTTTAIAGRTKKDCRQVSDTMLETVSVSERVR
jgi:hypothetical protein